MSDVQIIPADLVLPPKIYILPLLGKPIFPGIITPMVIHQESDMNVINASLAGDQIVGFLLMKSEELEDPDAADLYRVGTVARIVRKLNLPDGGLNIFITTLKRFVVKKYISSQTPITAAVEYIEEESGDSIEIKALTRALLIEMKQISENNPLFSEEMRLNMVNIDHPGKIADFIASILNVERKEQQKILETFDVRKRMESVLVFIKKEQELLRIQKKIQNQIEEKISKSQREYFLKEELKAIKGELGMPVDAKSQEYAKFKSIIEKLDFKGEIKEQVESELEKFSLMDPNSSEFIVTRNYLETIVTLPWEMPKAPEIDMGKAKKVLDDDHYGLEDVKDRILEYIAVRLLRKDTKGSIVCLVGPPGVGKTSVGKSIARALNKKFFRFSVGGMRDEAEIKGHRRTYVGAMPGKIIQGLKIVKVADPVFMIDEIDKLGVSYQGDPSSALLEVLDPEQNVAFRDHYLDLPFDISHILFITTANTLDTIPSPLLDRMEVIRLSGYINEEKVIIAKKYLIPKSLEKNGLKKKDVAYDRSSLFAIAENYAREAGVRNYEKALDKIHRKIARISVTDGIKFPLAIKVDDLAVYLKKPVFDETEQMKITKPGMALGLAWTPLGGVTLIIEAVANQGKEGFKLTGQMGDVMQESANIAYTYVREIALKYKVEKEFFEGRRIHLHIPAGATPKDGPSAGITMASCLLSLVLDKKIRPHLAMTGELSLVGRVLPIGGLKEKTIAAKRNKVKEIIIPEQNLKDLDEISENIKKGITFHPVKTMEEVIERILNKLMRARFRVIFFIMMSGFSGCLAENHIHPGFTITKNMLIDALKDMTDNVIRKKILSESGEFLDRMKLLLAEEQELLLLVDKKNPLEKTLVPAELVNLDEYAVEKIKAGMSVRKKIMRDLLLMNDAAKKDNITLVIASAYRSYSNQEAVYAYWVKLLGEEQASRESAQAGHSQHQLGTTIDFNPVDDSFAGTKADIWLKAHAAGFGFSLSYPSGYEAMTGYKYEPWHYRYTGKPACGMIDSYFLGIQQYFLEFYNRYADFFREHLKKEK